MKPIALLLVLMMATGAFAGILSLPSVSAADTHTWDGGAWPDHLASTAANWNADTLPEAGDSVVFDATNTSACTWDIAGNPSFGAFTLGVGYTATITQSATLTVASYTQTGAGIFAQGANVVVNGASTISAGTMTGSTSYTWTSIGNWIQSAGNTLTDARMRLIMNSNGAALTIASANSIYDVQVSENCTITRTSGSLFKLSHSIIIVAGKTLTIAAATTLYWYTYGGGSLTNSGSIAGTGIFELLFYNVGKTVIFGTVTCPVLVYLSVAATGSYACTLGSGTTFGSTLIISSDHVTNTMTLDLSTSNYALSATSITIGTRGILNARESTITCSGNWDSSAGTFTRGYSTVSMTGVGKTLKTGTQGFWNLVFPFASSTTLQSKVWAEGIGFSGSLTQAGYLINVSGAGEFALTATGSWDGDIYLNGTGTQYTIPIVVPFTATARIFSKVSTTYTNTTQGSVTVTPAVSTYGGIRLTTINKDYPIGANWSYIFPSGTVHFDVVLSPYTLYQMYVDDVATGDRVQTDAGGAASWEYSVVSESNFTLMGEVLEIDSTPPTSIVEDYLYLYTPTTNYTTGLTWGMDTNATWLSQYANGTVYGTPSNLFANQAFFLNISVTLDAQSDYQNFTLSVTNVAPVMNSTPMAWVYVELEFQYLAIFTDFADGGTFTGITTNFTGEYDLNLATGLFTFRSHETGIWYFNITFNDMTGSANATGYQYFLVDVIEGGPTSIMSIISLLAALTFCVLLMMVGFKDPTFWLLAGPVWILSGIAIFMEYSEWFMVMGAGLGIVLLMRGAYDVYK